MHEKFYDVVNYTFITITFAFHILNYYNELNPLSLYQFVYLCTLQKQSRQVKGFVCKSYLVILCLSEGCLSLRQSLQMFKDV